jgi:hypothetical protein
MTQVCTIYRHNSSFTTLTRITTKKLGAVKTKFHKEMFQSRNTKMLSEEKPCGTVINKYHFVTLQTMNLGNKAW